MDFNPKRARLEKPDMFKRFIVPDEGELLSKVNLNPKIMLLIVEINSTRRALLVKQMAYHHVAQGVLKGEPYVATFCGICHSGVVLEPLIDEKLYHFSAGGLYDGTVLLIDDETQTYWNHMTGEAVHGPLIGKKMTMRPLRIMNARSALEEDANTTISISKFKSMKSRTFGWMGQKFLYGKGFFPPGFHKTMGKLDNRLPEMTNGLGIMIENIQRFYPIDAIRDGIKDVIQGYNFTIKIRASDKVPFAKRVDNDDYPPQLFCRWYGFSYTYPDCEIFEITLEHNNKRLRTS
jgi:hypothetical protein